MQLAILWADSWGHRSFGIYGNPVISMEYEIGILELYWMPNAVVWCRATLAFDVVPERKRLFDLAHPTRLLHGRSGVWR